MSAYEDKFAGDNEPYMAFWGKKILTEYHPELPEEVKEAGRGVTFQVKLQEREKGGEGVGKEREEGGKMT